jgi:hypothetical protein
MKLHHKPPQTLQGKLVSRNIEIWMSHPSCVLAVGDLAPVSEVVHGKSCFIMVAKGPLMIARYCDKSVTQFLFDAYGT